MATRRPMGDVPPRLIIRPAKTEPVVKSAQRVLEILEFFADYQREASSIEVAEALKYPQSSTAALLKSLVSLGYLLHDRYRRTYISSCRVALLGSWIDSGICVDGDVKLAMKRVTDRTGEATVLITRNGMHVQYIGVVQAKDPTARRIGIGHLRPLATSAAGQCFLSVMPDSVVTPLITRAIAEGCTADNLGVKDLLIRLGEVRRRGYATAYGKVVKCGAVAVHLERAPGREPLVMGVSANADVIIARSSEFASVLREETELLRFPARMVS
jgi:DNA-binding IclR family transcriptional regulator